MTKLKPIFATAVKELSQRRWLLIGYTLTATVFLLMYAWVYPTIHQQSAKFNELFNAYPKSFLDAFGINKINMTTFEGYLSMEHFSLIWPLMTILLVVSFAGNALAGEIEKGTAALLLALPQSRLKIYFAKYFAGAAAIIVYTAISILAAIPAGWLFNIDVHSHNIIATVGPSLAFALAIFGLAMAASSYFSERGRVYMITGGGLLFMYVVNVISESVKSWEWLKYLSIFHYYKPLDIISGEPVNLWATGLLLVVAVVGALVGALHFDRRDISV